MDCSAYFCVRVVFVLTILSILSACSGKDDNGAPAPVIVSEPAPIINVSQSALTFSANSTSQTFTITNKGGGTLTWSIVDDRSWISILGNVTNQTTLANEIDQIVVTVTRGTLSQGSYTGSIRIQSSGGADVVISVSMIVSGIVQDPTNPSTPQVSISTPINNARFTPTDVITFSGSAVDLEDGAIPSTSLTWTSNLVTQPLGTGSIVMSSLSTGTHVITLSARDTSGLTGTATVTVQVTNTPGTPTPNKVPTITSTPPTAAILNVPFFYDVQAFDLDGDVLTYSLLGTIPNMTINTTTGLISWTPQTVGIQTNTIAVNDGRGGIVTQLLSLSVIAADGVSPVGTLLINNGAAQTGSNSVVVSLAASDNVGVANYMITDGGALPTIPAADDPAWLMVNVTPNYAATIAYNFSTNYVAGTQVTVYAWFKDAAGNISNIASDSILRATNVSPFNATLENFIEFGAVETNSNTVTLSLAATDDVTITGYFVVDNNTGASPGIPILTDPNWVDVNVTPVYVADVTYTFKATYLVGDIATVFVWFKDDSGQISLVKSDDILIATTGPNTGPIPTGNIFNEDFEGDISEWFENNNGVWGLVVSNPNSRDCYNGSQCLSTIESLLDPNMRESQVVSPIIDLANLDINNNGIVPMIELSFRQKANFGGTNGGRVEISQELSPGIFGNGELVYMIDSTLNNGSEENPWEQIFVDLTPFAGTSIRVHYIFVHSVGTDSGGDGDDSDDFILLDKNGNQSSWAIDNVNVGTVSVDE